MRQLDQLGSEVSELKDQMAALQPAIRLLNMVQWLADNKHTEFPPA